MAAQQTSDPAQGAPETGSGRKRIVLALIPFLVFAIFGAFFAVQLLGGGAQHALRSALIDQPAPSFSMESLRDGEGPFTDAVLKQGQVTVVNFWASWCAPCRIEHPKLMQLAEMGVPVYGVNYNDKTEPGRRFLTQLGDPFTEVGVDPNGRVAISWGLQGVPETFIVAGDGSVIYKHTGPIQNDDMERFILPAIEEAGKRG